MYGMLLKSNIFLVYNKNRFGYIVTLFATVTRLMLTFKKKRACYLGIRGLQAI